MTDGTMRPYAEVIGDPISHSRSPAIHRFWADALGLDVDYRATHVLPNQLADYFADRAGDPAWRGCNITLPHKVAALDLVTDPGQVRGTIGAINTVIVRDGVMIGTNTDAAGFMAPLVDMGHAPADAVIMGTGGAARAVLFGLRQSGLAHATIMARNPLKGAALLAMMGVKGTVIGFDAPMPPTSLLVNTTPLGMQGYERAMAVPDLSGLPDDAVVYDIIYTPRVTPLLAAAQARDLAVIDGLHMLIGQAALAFELFFGVAPPRDRDADLLDLLGL